MECTRCRTKNFRMHMNPIKRKGGFHKQTKFKCSECGLVRMKKNK